MSGLRPSVPPSAWKELEELEADHWARHKEELGPWAGFRAAAELRSHVRRARPDWPSPEERDADLAVHVRVGESLRRVG